MQHVNFNDKRHAMYREYQDMFDNYEDTYIDILRQRYKNDTTYLALGLAREVVLLYSDLAFGNPINALATNKATNTRIAELVEMNALNQQISEAAMSQAVKGGIVFKNYIDENGNSRISFIEPEFYFPIFSPFDQRKVVGETIGYKYTDRELNKGGNLIYTETYTMDENGDYWCETKVFINKNNQVAKEVFDEKKTGKVKTPLNNSSPLTYIPFVRTGASFWGDSIYKGSIHLYDEINNRVTQIKRVLDEHSDPIQWAVTSAFDDDGDLNLRDNRVVEVTEDIDGGRASSGDPLGYITWNWSAEANFKYIEDVMMKILYTVSPMAPSLYGLDETSQATGRATILKSWRTQCKVTRSQQYWRQALKKIIYNAQVLDVAAGNGKYTPEIPQIEMSLNMPVDYLENAQSEQLKVQSKLTSIKSSIARLNPHLTWDEVEEEYLEIIAEQNDLNALTFMTPPSPTDDTEDEEDDTEEEVDNNEPE